VVCCAFFTGQLNLVAIKAPPPNKLQILITALTYPFVLLGHLHSKEKLFYENNLNIKIWNNIWIKENVFKTNSQASTNNY